MRHSIHLEAFFSAWRQVAQSCLEEWPRLPGEARCEFSRADSITESEFAFLMPTGAMNTAGLHVFSGCVPIGGAVLRYVLLCSHNSDSIIKPLNENIFSQGDFFKHPACHRTWWHGYL